MCGIAGIVGKSRPDAHERSLKAMNRLQKHRGPDGEGVWLDAQGACGLAHVRLSIIDLSSGQQPMRTRSGNVITYNGEIYNYRELREQLQGKFDFTTTSDTEVILAAYERWGEDCVTHFRGMFAFALWDEKKQRLFCARDRFGIKPFYYLRRDGKFYFASEIKALLPFVAAIDTNVDALKDYLTFQFVLEDKTLFKDISQLLPAYALTVDRDGMKVRRYWEVFYHLDWDHSEDYFVSRIGELMRDSVRLHLRSDVPVGAYLSGGTDSSIVAALATDHASGAMMGFNGRFTCTKGFDESNYATDLAVQYGMNLKIADITSRDFAENIEKVIYHLDVPVAGPGSFPQYMVSKLAAQHCKVVLGGQGGDEIFGGYARYLVAYFEQCIKGAIDGTLHNGNFVVTYESIIPNLTTLGTYKPLMKEFWSEGLFDDIHHRYFKLVNRAPHLTGEIRWDRLGEYKPYETFQRLFLGDNVGHNSYFDLMTHFDFKTLLPALLQVEDRVSMAHGLESRVPFLDHPLIELAATIPANKKFKDGKLKRLLIKTFQGVLPNSIAERKDKMGFPVPLNMWIKGDLKDFVQDIFSSQKAQSRSFTDSAAILQSIGKESQFGRTVWGLLSLELWMRQFHDKETEFKRLIQ